MKTSLYFQIANWFDLKSSKIFISNKCDLLWNSGITLINGFLILLKKKKEQNKKCRIVKRAWINKPYDDLALSTLVKFVFFFYVQDFYKLFFHIHNRKKIMLQHYNRRVYHTEYFTTFSEPPILINGKVFQDFFLKIT